MSTSTIYVQTWEASATLWYLNGLKSSLMWIGRPFLGVRVPKNGFGGPEGVGLDSAAFGFGDDDEEAPFVAEEVLAGNVFCKTVSKRPTNI